MIHELDKILVCKKYESEKANGFLPIKSIGGGDFFFCDQDDLDGNDYKQINVAGVFTKNGRVVVTRDLYLPFTPVIDRDDDFAFKKDNDSVMFQAAKRMMYEAKVDARFDDLRLIGSIDENDSITYIYGAEICGVNEGFEMHVLDATYLKKDTNIPQFTKDVVSAVC